MEFITVLSGVNDAKAIQDAINLADGQKEVVLSGAYYIDNAIVGKDVKIQANDAIIYVNQPGDALVFQGVERALPLAVGGYTKGTNYLLLQDTSNIQVGDLVRFYSTSETFHPSRSYYYKGANFEISKVDVDRIWFYGALPYDITTVTNVEVYDPAKVNINGKLRIEYLGDLPNGENGLKLERVKDAHISGVTVDNFVTCITPRFSVNVTMEDCKTERSLYTGTGTSYGLATISSTNVTYRNCQTRTGRHGHASGGWEPVMNLKLENCLIFSESESTVVSMDTHDNTWNVIMENCEMDSFRLAGNVVMKNCTVHHKIVTTSSFITQDEEYKANYLFENMNFPNGGAVTLSGYSQSGGTWTMDSIGSFVAKNWYANNKFHLDFKGKDSQISMPVSTINSVQLDNINNVQVLIKDNIKMLSVNQCSYKSDAVFIYQYEGRIDNVKIDNCVIPARYTSVLLKNFDTCLIQNCSDIDVANTSGSINLSGTGIATILNCNFNNMARGLSSSVSKLRIIGSNVPIYTNTTVDSTTI